MNGTKLSEKQAPATIIGVLIITLVGSIVYDMLVKPGLSSFGRLVLDIVTLGSSTIKDSAYSSAALNPTTISTLILLFAILGAVNYLGFKLIISVFFNRSESDDYVTESCDTKKRNYLKLKLKSLALVLTLFFIGVFIGLEVHSQSILIWRVFQANYNIVAPYITAEERLSLMSSFCSMQKKSDYQPIHNRFLAIEAKFKIKLQKPNLW